MADGRSQKTRSIAASIASIEDPSTQLGPILRGILQHNDQIVEQNQAILQLLNYHVNALPPLPANAAQVAAAFSGKDGKNEELKRRETVGGQRCQLPSLESRAHVLSSDGANDEESRKSIWGGILTSHSSQSASFAAAFQDWKRPLSLRDVFQGKHEWTSKSYYWAFPDLVDFLCADDLPKRCHAQATIKDFSLPDRLPWSSAYSESRPRFGLLRNQRIPRESGGAPRRKIRGTNAEDPFGCALLWEALGFDRSQSPNTPPEDRIWMRSVHILDLSPKVLSCLLASTPRIDLSYMAAFTQRYLSSNNWGKAAFLRYGDLMTSYTLEYHFAFYYVKHFDGKSSERNSDDRKLRKSAPFGGEFRTRPCFIHEESLSFLFIGHFKDVATCVQLGENYFKYDPYRVQDPESSEPSVFRPLSPRDPPALMFLDWLSVALHHVLWRWQSAIDAVHAEIKTSRQIVFMHDRSDLMADDPQFSLSKTYFWALQAYKLFDDTISDTIQTWEDFKTQSLPSLRDGRVADGEWDKRVQHIEDAITELGKKLERIRKRTEEVRELRRGLISASALFDSRTSVRQGENIRLLTYITILFFPLSFATSIFGMDIVGGSTTAVKAFAIVLPLITVATGFFVFNLQNFVDSWDAFTGAVSGWLRKSMREHPRELWGHRAMKLQHDLANTKAPVRKLRRSTSAWMYVVFIFELVVVGIPVGELAFFVRRMRKTSSAAGQAKEDMEDENAFYEESIRVERTKRSKVNDSLAKEAMARRQERRTKMGPASLAIVEAWEDLPSVVIRGLKSISDYVRMALLPIWLLLVGFELVVLLSAFAVVYVFTPSKTRQRAGSNAKSSGPWHRAYHALGLDVALPSSLSAERPPRPPLRLLRTKSNKSRRLDRAATQGISGDPSDRKDTGATYQSDQAPRSRHVHTKDLVPISAPPAPYMPPATRPLRLADTATSQSGSPFWTQDPPVPVPQQTERRPETFFSESTTASDHPERSTIDFIEKMSHTANSTPRTIFSPTLLMPDSPRQPHSSTGYASVDDPLPSALPALPSREAPSAPRSATCQSTPASPVESGFSVQGPESTTTTFGGESAPSLPGIQLKQATAWQVASSVRPGEGGGKRLSLAASECPASPTERPSSSSNPSGPDPDSAVRHPDTEDEARPRQRVPHLGRNLEARMVSLASRNSEPIEVLDLTRPPKPPPKDEL